MSDLSQQTQPIQRYLRKHAKDHSPWFSGVLSLSLSLSLSHVSSADIMHISVQMKSPFFYQTGCQQQSPTWHDNRQSVRKAAGPEGWDLLSKDCRIRTPGQHQLALTGRAAGGEKNKTKHPFTCIWNNNERNLLTRKRHVQCSGYNDSSCEETFKDLRDIEADVTGVAGVVTKVHIWPEIHLKLEKKGEIFDLHHANRVCV